MSKNTKFCPACGEFAVPPSGPDKSKILLIGEFPGGEELEVGRAFVGRAGGILRKELERVGIDMNDLRIMNLHLHPPLELKYFNSKTTMNVNEKRKAMAVQNEKCLKVGYELVLEEAKKRKSILLIGSDVVSTFTEFAVSNVTGLEVDSIFTCKHVWAVINPAMLFHNKGVGELRLALSKWRSMLKENKIY